MPRNAVGARNLLEVERDEEVGGGLDAELLEDAVRDAVVGVFDCGKRKVFAVFLNEEGTYLGELFDVGAGGGVDDGFDGFLEAGVALPAVSRQCCGVGCEGEGQGRKEKGEGTHLASMSWTRARRSSQ